MAARRPWDSLSPAYRARLSRGGITKSSYQSGASLAAARGHAQTPEHGLKDAVKNPGKYQKYLQKRQPKPKPSAPPAPGPEQLAREHNALLDRAFASMARLRPYFKYYEPTVKANVYGGTTRESGEVPGMSTAEAQWTIEATIEQIRAQASTQYTGNPWFYH